MPINDLPKSLIAAASEVVEHSSKKRASLEKAVFSEGLSILGVLSEKSLTEEQKKALHSWAQLEIERRIVSEAACSCGGEMSEDDMPGDEVFHKDGEESGEKKKEIDEDEDELKEGGMPSSVIKHKQQISYMSPAEFAQKYAKLSHDDLLSMAWSHGYGKGSTEYVNKMLRGQKELEKLKITENIALAADEIATNGAVAVGDANFAEPKHADVIKDSSPLNGTTEYRVLIQFATNEGTHIYPPVSLPGAPTVAALRDLVEGLPYFNEVVDAALVHAASGLTESTSTIKTPLHESYVSIIATSDVYAKDRSRIVLRLDQAIPIDAKTAKNELSKMLKIGVKDLFVDSDHEKLFDFLVAKGRPVYIYTDPFDFDVNNTSSLGVAATKKEALKQEEDSAGDI